MRKLPGLFDFPPDEYYPRNKMKMSFSSPHATVGVRYYVYLRPSL